MIYKYYILKYIGILMRVYTQYSGILQQNQKGYTYDRYRNIELLEIQILNLQQMQFAGRSE